MNNDLVFLAGMTQDKHKALFLLWSLKQNKFEKLQKKLKDCVAFFESRGNTQVLWNFKYALFESSPTFSFLFKGKSVVFRFGANLLNFLKKFSSSF